jgi:hypothetical protein
MINVEEDQLRSAFLLTVGVCAISGFVMGALAVLLLTHFG